MNFKYNTQLRDMDPIKTIPNGRVGFSINTLDETFKDDMDKAVKYSRCTLCQLLIGREQCRVEYCPIPL